MTATKWHDVPCPCGRGTIPGSLYEAGKRTCGNEPDPLATFTGPDFGPDPEIIPTTLDEEIMPATYTPAQARQMAEDTSFVSRIVEGEFGAEERDYAVVLAPVVGEADPHFYIDREWLAWFADNVPQFSAEEMADSPEADESWVVWIIRRVADGGPVTSDDDNFGGVR